MAPTKQINNSNIPWITASRYSTLTEDEIRENQDSVCWERVSVYQSLSEKFIEEFSDKVNWTNISIGQRLSEDFILKHQTRLKWKYIFKHQKLSESFIEKYCIDKIDQEVDWASLLINQNLSDDFIINHQEHYDIYSISSFRKFSTKALRTFADKVNWKSIQQKYINELPEEFVAEMQMKGYIE